MADFSPLLDFAGSIASAMVTVCVPIAVAYLVKKTGIELDQSSRTALTTAIERGLGKAIQVGTAAGDKSLSDVHVKSQAMQAVIDYVTTNAPDAIAHFGLSPADVAEKVGLELDKMMHVTGTATAPVTVPMVPVTAVAAPITLHNAGTITAG